MKSNQKPKRMGPFRQKHPLFLVIGLLVLGSAIRTTYQRAVLLRTPNKKHRVVFGLRTNPLGTLQPICSLLSSQLQIQLLFGRVCDLYIPIIKITSTAFWIVVSGITSSFLLHFSQSLCFLSRSHSKQHPIPPKISRFLVGKNFWIVGWDDRIPCRNPLAFCFAGTMILAFCLVMQLGLLSQILCLKEEGKLVGENDNAVFTLTSSIITQLQKIGTKY
jgi:hypothetical protein